MDLEHKRVRASAPRPREPAAPATLFTPWGEALASCQSLQEDVLSEHPRPQFARSSFQILNGWWDYAIIAYDQDSCTGATTNPSTTGATHPSVVGASETWRTAEQPAKFDGSILVPFSPESLLSGVGRQLQPNELLWYRRTFCISPEFAEHRIILHFDAVDYACACYINGVAVGEHVGGYLPFSFDITDALSAADTGASHDNEADGTSCGTGDGKIELTLCVFDPSDTGTQLRGKQKLEASGIWYTAQSGIWQSVWLEAVPEPHIERVELHPDAPTETLLATVHVLGPKEELQIRILDENGNTVASAATAASTNDDQKLSLSVSVPQPHLWSPDNPYLYQLELRYGADIVRSYCAFRTLTMQRDETGAQRFFLNGEPLFLRGVLDQGYWSDGLMTAPSDDALVSDIHAMKDAGFNMLRKHIKVESARWYYHCDRLGMLVWQDMVTGGSPYSAWHTSYKPTLLRASWGRYDDSTPAHYTALSAGDSAYREEWERTCQGTIEHLGNHPCIVTWVLFNEAWGQFEAQRITDMVRKLDPSRPIDAVSGWYDQRCGDYLSVHNYFRELKVYPDKARRAFVISEFGGIVYHVPGHTMLSQSYGYEVFDDAEFWRNALVNQLATVDALETQGLAGYVYTQLSDVEEETNGILTYDRRVNKLKAINGPTA